MACLQGTLVVITGWMVHPERQTLKGVRTGLAVTGHPSNMEWSPMSNIGAHNYLLIVLAAAPAPAYHLRRIGRASPLIKVVSGERSS